MATALLDLPWSTFIQEYPYPAFVLGKKAGSVDGELSLLPVWSNSAYQCFVYGVPQNETAEITRGTRDFGQAFFEPSDIIKFATWVDKLAPSTLKLTLRPASWTVSSDSPVFLLAKSPVDISFESVVDLDNSRPAPARRYVLVTTIPLTLLSSAATSPKVKTRRSPEGKREVGMRIQDMPPPAILSSASATSTAYSSRKQFKVTQQSRLTGMSGAQRSGIERPLIPVPAPGGEMAKLISEFDWTESGLGPISSWPASLRSSLSFVLAAPYPAALWWGPDLVLLYNDGYARMSGNKHPSMLGLKGLVSWRELNWDVLGPLTERVMRDGKAVAKVDDLLFFNKLGEKMGPEETYHCWSWTPVRIEDGSVGGMINFTFESTQKVITSRRLEVLREIGERTLLCKNEHEFAETVIDALFKNNSDAPFVALYTCSANTTLATSMPMDPNNTRPSSSQAEHNTISALSPLKVDLTLIRKKGIKEDNESLPTHLEMEVDPLTIRYNPSRNGNGGLFDESVSGSGSARPEAGAISGIAGLGRSGSAKVRMTDGRTVGIAGGRRSNRPRKESNSFTGTGSGGRRASSFSATVSRDETQAEYGVARTPVNYSTAASNLTTPTGLPMGFDIELGKAEECDVQSSPNVDAYSVQGLVTAQIPDSPTPMSGTPIPEPSFRWPFSECFISRSVRHVDNVPAYVAPSIDGKVAWGDSVREALLIPISAKGEDLPSAVLVMGCNPRRPYDEDYSTWVDVLQSSLSNGWEATKARGDEIMRVEQLQSLDAAKTAFFSNASHELRTPLTLIYAPLEDCISRVTDTLIKDSLKLAFRNASRLSRLIDSLMDFSRLEGGRLRGTFKPVQLSSFTLDLANMFRSTMERHNLEYIIECNEQDKQICYVDPELWEKVCFNLIGNAYKYTMNGHVRVRLEFTETTARFSVEDTGVGIPRADLPKLGQKFHRVASVSRSIEGTGIGLSLTKELILLHGGILEVESTAEEESTDGRHGSIFTVILKLGRSHLPRSIVDEKPGELPMNSKYARGMVEEVNRWGSTTSGEDATTPSESSDSGGSSEGSRLDPSVLFFSKSDLIMIVDDNAEMRRYIKSLLIPFCRVIEAANGRDALAVLKAHTPDVIVCDRMMPFIDGFELLELLKQDPVASLIPVILLTAQAADEARVDGLLRGFDDYLSKPFRGRELIARVHLQMQLGKKRRQLEAAFLEHTREIKLLADLSPVGICRTDQEGRITYTNARYHDLTDIREIDASVVSLWRNHVHPEDVGVAEQLWHAALDDQQAGSGEFRWKNGIWTQVQLEVIYIQEDKFVGFLGTLTDISERKLYEASERLHSKEREYHAQKRLEEAELRRMEADERRRSQELLIDVTSHELRQPVSAILNCSSLVRSNLASLRIHLQQNTSSNAPFVPTPEVLSTMDEDLDALDAIYQCGLAQERIANDVLSLSRIQLQVLTIHPVDFDIVPEVERIVGVFRNEVKMKRIDLSLRIGRSFERLGLARVKTDKARFAQVITNLLSNAIKFADMSTSERRIMVELDLSPLPAFEGPCVPPFISETEIYDWTVPKPVYIFVSVQDSGPGLKPDDLALLFRRFAQGSNSHEVFGGSGLGLFVSRQLCELMGGRIDVDSVFGNGATFRFYIKASTSELHSEPSRSLERIQSPQAHAREVLTRPLHILITEDNLINQTILNRQLKKDGCTTEVANNGSEAIEKILALVRKVPGLDPGPDHFDAVLMDCEMPVMDGYTAVRQIRLMEASGQLPKRNRIFALTGNAREGQVESARSAGMDHVFIKPYKFKELMARLRDDA